MRGDCVVSDAHLCNAVAGWRWSEDAQACVGIATVSSIPALRFNSLTNDYSSSLDSYACSFVADRDSDGDQDVFDNMRAAAEGDTSFSTVNIAVAIADCVDGVRNDIVWDSTFTCDFEQYNQPILRWFLNTRSFIPYPRQFLLAFGTGRGDAIGPGDMASPFMTPEPSVGGGCNDIGHRCWPDGRCDELSNGIYFNRNTNRTMIFVRFGDPESCDGTTCAAPNVLENTCTHGRCDALFCNADWGNCNDDPADGCETDLTSEPTSCGACGVTCAQGEVCEDSFCVRPVCAEMGITRAEGGASVRLNNQSWCAVKAANGTSCAERCRETGGQSCVQWHIDRFHAALMAEFSGNTRQVLFNMESGWSGGLFTQPFGNGTGFACNSGTAYVLNTPWGANDGACMGPYLPMRLSCDDTEHVGFADLGYGTICACGYEGNGDPNDCGANHTVCDLANTADHACVNGRCFAGSCDPGYADCDNGIDGCETDVRTTSNCGACGVSCNGGEVCVRGGCVPDVCGAQGITRDEGGDSAYVNGDPYCVVKLANGTSCDSRCQAVAGVACDATKLAAFEADMDAADLSDLTTVLFDMEPGWTGGVTRNPNNEPNTGFSCNSSEALVLATPWGTNDGFCGNPILPGTFSCTATTHVGWSGWGAGSLCVCGP